MCVNQVGANYNHMHRDLFNDSDTLITNQKPDQCGLVYWIYKSCAAS